MKDMGRLRILVVILLTVLIGACSSATSKKDPVVSDRPNIIFLMIDDCSAVEFSCYATPEHPSGNQTPVIDALARDGVQFTTCWAAPLCMPARALLMSGKYGARTGVYGNKLSRHDPDFAKKHSPFPKVLKDAGYETAISGKWHLPGDAGQEEYGLDEYSLLGGYFRPFEEPVVWEGLWFSWTEASKTFYDKAEIGRNRGKYPALYWNGCVVENGELLPSDSLTYAPDLCQDFALDFITRERGNPFFLYYPIVLPHDPWFGAPDPENPGSRTEPGFPSQIVRMEYYVNELVQTLKQKGLYENTIVFLTADNATLGNGKGSCSELGVRVPLIVFGGAVKARGVSENLVDFSDMYPTVLEMAGIENYENEGRDGVSFGPVLKDQSFTGRDFIFSYLDMERCVRTKEYMMDGIGGIWKCSSNGNLLDYKPQPEGPETELIREKLLGLIEGYKLPDEGEFSRERIESATNPYPWPSLHPTTLFAFKNGDEWMNNPRRIRE